MFKVLFVGFCEQGFLAPLLDVSIFDKLVEFFAGYTWESLPGVFFALILGVFPGFSIFQLIKNWLKWEGQKANYLVLILSGGLGFLSLLVTGDIDFANLETLNGVWQVGFAIYTASQLWYKRFKSKNSPLGA